MTWTEPSEIIVECIKRRVSNKAESFVLVEGTTDRALWAEYASDQNCFIYPIKADEKIRNNKAQIVTALENSQIGGVPGVAGIVDADYWLITQADELRTANLLYDDCCPDMEAILLSSPALGKVLRHSTKTDDIDLFHDFADKLKAEAQRIASDFGHFRLLNHLKDYGLRCNAIPLEEVIDRDTLELDKKLVASRLSGGKPGINGEDLLQEVDNLREVYPLDSIQLCRGKDLVGIIALILPSLFKSEFDEDLPPGTHGAFREKTLSINLRSAYEYGYFVETSLFNGIRKWESENTPFRIIKD